VSTPKTQIFALAPVNRLQASIRSCLSFYAPLEMSLAYMGIEACTFTRAGTSTATWRDGASHNVGANEPRFEWSGGEPLGLLLNPVSETLQFAAANLLHDSNTLVWIEEGVFKSTTAYSIARAAAFDPGAFSEAFDVADTIEDVVPESNTFNSSGVWTRAGSAHRRRIAKFNRALTSDEVAYVAGILA